MASLNVYDNNRNDNDNDDDDVDNNDINKIDNDNDDGLWPGWERDCNNEADRASECALSLWRLRK